MNQEQMKEKYDALYRYMAQSKEVRKLYNSNWMIWDADY